MGQVIAPFCLVLFWQIGVGVAGALEDRARQLCLEVGVPLHECTLLPEGRSGVTLRQTSHIETDAERGTKVETLTEHARELCAKQRVALEDCVALPEELRTTDQAPIPEAAPVTPRYNPPVRMRKIVRSRAYQPPATDQPAPAYSRAPAYRSAPSPRLAPGYEAHLTGVPVVGVPYAPAPLERRGEAVLYRNVPVDRYVPPPRGYRNTGRYLRPSEAPPVVYEERIRPLRPTYRNEAPVRYSDRDYERGSGVRCNRSVRYSSPPSYRYVTCD